jgi:acyl-CoA thioesterase
MNNDSVPNLATDTIVSKLAEGRFGWSVPQGWSEGRSTWSGVVVAALAHAISMAEPDDARLLRNMTTELLAAVHPGPTEITVRSLRRGLRQSTFQADLTREGEVLVTATAMLARPRRVVVESTVLAPQTIPPPEEIPPLPIASESPDLMRRFEFRPAVGAPLSGAQEAVVRGWLRLVEPSVRVDAALLLALIDAPWPAALATVKTSYKTTTSTASSAIACDPRTVDVSEPLFFVGRTLFDHQGFQMEGRELYDRSGRLLCTNQRTFVVLT